MARDLFVTYISIYGWVKFPCKHGFFFFRAEVISFSAFKNYQSVHIFLSCPVALV